MFYGAVQEFRVAEDADGGLVVGCGALHVMWEDLAEVRTLAVDPRWRSAGGSATRSSSGSRRTPRELGVNKLFCLTFEVDFFAAHGYAPVGEGLVGPDVVRRAGPLRRRRRRRVPRSRPGEAEHARQHADAQSARSGAVKRARGFARLV